MATKARRRLTTVMCADVKGYTALMTQDEDGTLGTLRAYRTAMQALIAQHNGRMINTWGDAVIAEFPSVVDALRCAIDIQHDLAARNRQRKTEERMWFRIGINLGDVMVEGEDIYGEGVNIAARLQELAEPGGILITGAVYEQVRNKLSVGFEAVEPRSVKNVAEPVLSYRVRLKGRSAPSANLVAVAHEPMHRADAKSPDQISKPAPPWYALNAWPWWIKLSVLISGLFFAINAAAGLSTVWFYWPSLPFLFAIAVYLLITLLRARRG